MKYCDECKKKYPDAESFCESCGNKLIEYLKPKVEVKEKPRARHKESRQPTNFSDLPQNINQWHIGGVVAVILMVVLISVGNNQRGGITGAFTPATTTVCTYVQEPYQEQETYQTPISYSLIANNIEEKWNTELGFYYIYALQIANTDDYGGTFSVKLDLTTSKPRTLTETKTLNIQAHDSGILQAIFNTDVGEKVRGDYSITPPTKTAYRTITKYRTVQKCA